MIHGSYENRTDRPRRAVVINAFRDGVCSGSDDELLAGVPPIPKGPKDAGPVLPAAELANRFAPQNVDRDPRSRRTSSIWRKL